MLVVLDTNVLVSGLVAPQGAPAKILDMMLISRLQPAFSDLMIYEYYDVLSRKKFSEIIDKHFAAEVLNFITSEGAPVTAMPLQFPGKDIHDPTDVVFAEVSVASGAAAIVTGNIRHFNFFEKNPYGIRILTPVRALELLC